MSQYRARVHDRFASLLVVLVLLMSSCSASTQIPLRDVTAPSVAAEGDSTADSTIGAALSSEEVYREIEKSIVYVEAPDGLSSGSGFVIDGGWIVTNAHVVDRHQSMQIGRSDGSGLGLVPVHAVDWVFDLALIGPIDDLSLLPIARGESASLSLGSRVLLAGFPDEDSATPTPTLTEGIVSRRRFVAIGDYPFVQVDATIAPGQSGGALINGRGELVGISGLEFGEGEFGLAFASDPMWPRVEDMIAVGGLALPSGPPSFELTGQVGPLRNFSFTLEVEESGSVDVLVTSVADVWVDLQTLGGITVGQAADSVDPFRSRSEGDTQWYIDDLVEGGEEILATLDPGTYQVVIGGFTDTVTDVEITSVNPLRVFADVEEGQTLPPNQIVEGDFDWPRDTDQWELPLTVGQRATITADGISDTVLVVRLDDVVIATSDDEGLGLFGTGSQITFTASDTATYMVEVGTFDQTRWGYLLWADVAG